MQRFHAVAIALPLFAAVAGAQSKPASAPAKPKASDAVGGVEVKGNRASVQIPGQTVTIHFTADEFKPEQNSQFGGKSLAYGGILKEATLNVYYETNFPYLSSLNYREQWKQRPNYQSYSANNVACCEFTNEAKGAFIQSFYHGHVVTNAYAFDLNVTVARIELKGSPPSPKFNRDDFIKIVKSFEVEGEPDIEKYRLPKEVYDYRDTAAKHEGDQLGWVAKEVKKESEDYPLYFYYGVLSMKRKQPDFASTGFSRAAEILMKKEKRTPKEDIAMLDALAGAQMALISTKHFREAATMYQKLLDIVKAESGEEFKKARDESIYGLAVCCAQTSQPERAIETLRNAVAANPLLKRRAKEDPFFAPIKNSKEFTKLVES
ncbi:MAG: hypothetical protein HY286_13735 [Planctomycetes bacterium]|nr:hypothetical protein [Planctomycetota bacterium]